MTAGIRVRTDRATFERWARGLPGLTPPDLPRPGPAGPAPPQELWPQPGRSGGLRPPVPPMVAASLAVHGCAEAVVTVRLTLPEASAVACFGVAGDLAAGLLRRGDQIEVGLFPLGELVAEVIRLVPAVPPDPIEAATGCVRISVLGPEAEAPGWQQILVSGESRWRRMQSGGTADRWLRVADVHRELAADLRFALAECLGRAVEGG